MKLNPTFLEIVLALLASILLYIWAKYGKHIRRWWKGLHKRQPPAPTRCSKWK